MPKHLETWKVLKKICVSSILQKQIPVIIQINLYEMLLNYIKW